MSPNRTVAPRIPIVSLGLSSRAATVISCPLAVAYGAAARTCGCRSTACEEQADNRAPIRAIRSRIDLPSLFKRVDGSSEPSLRNGWKAADMGHTRKASFRTVDATDGSEAAIRLSPGFALRCCAIAESPSWENAVLHPAPCDNCPASFFPCGGTSGRSQAHQTRDRLSRGARNRGGAPSSPAHVYDHCNCCVSRAVPRAYARAHALRAQLWQLSSPYAAAMPQR